MLDVNRLRVIDAVARHGSVTAAARELHYSQPSVTHHLARLEAETGAQLLQRVGRGIRLTPAGQLLADRAAEIIGRIDAAGAELSAHVGLTAGRVRLAAFASAIGSLVPPAVAALAGRHPGLEISLTDTHPPEAIELLRTGKVEVAIIFRYDETEPEPPGVRLHHLLDDPVYVLSPRQEPSLAALRDATWIAGCERCRSHLLSVCADAGFDPRIGYSSDDMVVMAALVAAGLGVATQSGLALRAHHIEGIVATELPDFEAAHLRRDLRRAARPARHRCRPGGPRRGRRHTSIGEGDPAGRVGHELTGAGRSLELVGAGDHRERGLGRAILERADMLQHEAAASPVDRSLDALQADEVGGLVRVVCHQPLGGRSSLDVARVLLGDRRLGELGDTDRFVERLLVPSLDLERCADLRRHDYSLG